MHRRLFLLICLAVAVLIGAYSGRVWAQGQCSGGTLCSANGWIDGGIPAGKFVKHTCPVLNCDPTGASTACLHEQCQSCKGNGGFCAGGNFSQCPTKPGACDQYPTTPFLCANLCGCQ
jgi:hypothetical protein